MTNITNEEFESKYNCKVVMLTQDEVCAKYDIDEDELKSYVLNYEKQTLPIELLVVEKNNEPYIYHAKRAWTIEDNFKQHVTF